MANKDQVVSHVRAICAESVTVIQHVGRYVNNRHKHISLCYVENDPQGLVLVRETRAKLAELQARVNQAIANLDAVESWIPPESSS